MFQRTTRKVSLTAEGLAFLSDAQQIQALTHRALDRFAHPQDQPFVPFALGSVFHLHLLWLAPALRRLREELPCTPCSRWRAGRTSSSCWRRAA